MSKQSRQTKQLKRSNTAKPNSQSARERARVEAELAARKSRDKKVLIGIAVAAVLLGGAGVGGYAAYQQFSTPDVTVAGPEQQVSVPAEPGAPLVYGTAADAPQLDIYLDFACPHCRTFEEEQGQTVQQMAADGDIQAAYYPLSYVGPPVSANAANAFVCAAERGFGQSYMQNVFANQNLSLNDNQLVSLARDVGGDAAGNIAGCISRKQHMDWVDSVEAAERPQDFSGTPSIYADGARVEWYSGMTPDQFRQAVTAAAG